MAGGGGGSGARGAYLESEELAAMGAAALLDISGALRTFFVRHAALGSEGATRALRLACSARKRPGRPR